MKYNSEIQRRREKKLNELREFGKFNRPSYPTKRYFNEDYEFDNKIKNRFLVKELISLVIIAVVFFVFQSNHQYAKVSQSFITDALNKDFNFNGLYAMYKDKFTGNPAILPTFEIIEKDQNMLSSPVSLPIGIDENKYGVFLETDGSSSVQAIDRGLVVKIGVNSEYGNTVIIKHQNGIEAIYANLDTISVENNIWLEQGDQIGTVKDKLYLAIKQGDNYLNPLDVIAFD